jgi:hypothetical protein
VIESIETITLAETCGETGGELFAMSYETAPLAAIADGHGRPHQGMSEVHAVGEYRPAL